MPINSTELVHGIDFTGLNPASAADHNTLVDSAVAYQDGTGTGKGLILTTTDTALNTPDVPDPTVLTRWKHYVWLRIPHATAVGVHPQVYGWIDSIISVPTFLKWIQASPDLSTLNANVATALANATAAQALAASANATAAAASTLANSVSSVATNAENTANTAETTATKAEQDAQTGIANAAAANSLAQQAYTLASNPKGLSAAIGPGNPGQRIRTNDGGSATEWYNEDDNYAIVCEQYNNGNDGPPLTNGLLQDRVLNAILTNMNPALTLSANKWIQFVRAGVYKVKARAPISNSTGDAHHVLVIAANDNVTTWVGTAAGLSSVGGICYAEVEAKVTVVIGTLDAIKIQDAIFGTSGTIHGGAHVGAGYSERYTLVEVTRLR